MRWIREIRSDPRSSGSNERDGAMAGAPSLPRPEAHLPDAVDLTSHRALLHRPHDPSGIGDDGAAEHVDPEIVWSVVSVEEVNTRTFKYTLVYLQRF